MLPARLAHPVDPARTRRPRNTARPGLPGYAELRCRSNFSFLNGASHPEELVAHAQALRYEALAITDECSLAGVVRAHLEAERLGMRLLIGTEMLLHRRPPQGGRGHAAPAPLPTGPVRANGPQAASQPARPVPEHGVGAGPDFAADLAATAIAAAQAAARTHRRPALPPVPAPAPAPAPATESASASTPVAKARPEPTTDLPRRSPALIARESDGPPPWVVDAWPPSDDDTAAGPAPEPQPLPDTVEGGASAPSAATPAADGLAITALGELWSDTVRPLIRQGLIAALVRELALQAELVQVQPLDGGGRRWRLHVARETLRAQGLADKLLSAMQAVLAEPVALDIEPGLATDSIALRDAAAREAAQQEAEALVHGDPLVKELMAQFRTARIVPGSIKPLQSAPADAGPTH